jgi:hypothetical protein
MTYCTSCGTNNEGAYCTNCGKTFAIKCCSKCLRVSSGNFCPNDGKPVVSMTHSQYKREKEAREMEKMMAGMLVSPRPLVVVERRHPVAVVVERPGVAFVGGMGFLGGGGFGLPLKKDGTPDRRYKVNK